MWGGKRPDREGLHLLPESGPTRSDLHFQMIHRPPLRDDMGATIFVYPKLLNTDDRACTTRLRYRPSSWTLISGPDKTLVPGL